MLCYGQEGLWEDKGSIVYECWFVMSTWRCFWQPAGISVQTHSRSQALYSCQAGGCDWSLTPTNINVYGQSGLSCLLCCYKCTPPWKWCLWCELTHNNKSSLGSLCMWFIFCVLGAKPKYQAKAVNKSALTKAPQKSETTKTSRWVILSNIIVLISVLSHCFLCIYPKCYSVTQCL